MCVRNEAMRTQPKSTLVACVLISIYFRDFFCFASNVNQTLVRYVVHTAKMASRHIASPVDAKNFCRILEYINL